MPLLASPQARDIYGTFGSSEFMNRDFGVTADEATSSGLNQADLSGGHRATGVQLVYRRDQTANLQMTVDAGVELYGSEIQESDIARDDFEAEVADSLVWRFRAPQFVPTEGRAMRIPTTCYPARRNHGSTSSRRHMIAMITDPPTVRRPLPHLTLPPDPLPIAPACERAQSARF